MRSRIHDSLSQGHNFIEPHPSTCLVGLDAYMLGRVGNCQVRHVQSAGRGDVCPAFDVAVHGQHLTRQRCPAARHRVRGVNARFLFQLPQGDCRKVGLSVRVPPIQLHESYML